MAALPPVAAEPALVQTLRWVLRPVAYLDDLRRRYGDAFGIRLVGFERPLFLVADPEAVGALYREPAHGLPAGRSAALLPILGPRSVLLLEGAEHLARRRTMLPPFHGGRMRAYEAVVREAAAEEIARLPVGRAFPLHPAMQAVTLEVILRAVFGVAEPGRRAALGARLRELLQASSSPALQLAVLLTRRSGRVDPLRRLRGVLGSIDALLLAEIAERRRDPALERREDVLSLLLGARDEDGGGLDDRELRDQLMTLLLAGHETTATALAWTFDLLLHDPAALARLRADLDGGDGRYARAVVAEALRLRPVVALAGRRLAAPLQAGPYTLPEGSDVTPAMWLLHTREASFPEARAFRPERFLDRPPAGPSWVPFGGGVRRCLGAAFAEFEMRVVLEEVLRRCDLRPADARRERVARRNVTFSPRHGTRVVARPRS